MARRRRKKNQKRTAVLLLLLLAVFTIVLGAFAILHRPDEEPAEKPSSSVSEAVRPGTESSSEPSEAPSQEPESEPESEPQQKPESQPESEAPQEPEEDKPSSNGGNQFFNRPTEMRAVYLTPGKDYLLDGNLSEASVKAGIDKALTKAKELTMNSVIFELQYKGQNIYLNTALPKVPVEFDILQYGIEKARSLGLYVYAIFDSFQEEDNGVIVPADEITAQVADSAVSSVARFVSAYSIDGILLDSYYHPQTERSYDQYLRSGGGIGFENYMRSASEDVYMAMVDAVRTSNPGVQVGMMTEAVWANKSVHPEGSATAAAFTAYDTGNADNKKFVEEGYADFIAVKAFGSTEDGRVPFGTVVNWWGRLASEWELPLYVVHASDKMCTDHTGWTEYDQLAKQVITCTNTPGFSGSIYNSLSRMLEDPKESTTKLIQFYNGEINPKHIMTELALTAPAQKTFTTFEQSVTFKGASDVNTAITINGQRISTDRNGYFAVNMPLKEGLNKFTIVHKGRTEVYKITRQVEIIKDVAPAGNLMVDGGMKVTITAVAYDNARVYATVGGQTIPMTKMEVEDETTEKDSTYAKFAGTYTAPAATTSIQNIGNIVVCGEVPGIASKQKQGAYLKVNKRMEVSDGQPIQVIAEQAETFPTYVLNDYSHPDYFPLPKGTIDYAVGSEILYSDGNKSFSYYNLASDLRVYTKDIKAVSESYGVEDNVISGMTVTSDSRYTKVIFNTRQKVSYKASYDSGAFRITFNYTVSHPESMNLNKNPLFTRASWNGATVSLQFAKTNGFLGYTAYYDASGNLVMRFNNPPEVSGSSLKGAKIMVDPGHGGSDPGALGFHPAYPESVIVREIADRLETELRRRGASVYKLETNTNPKTTIDIRMNMARQYDPHLFISLHANSSPNSSASGSEVYYFNEYSKAFAGYAAAGIANGLGTSNRGGRFGYYYVTRDPQFPAVLCEVGFLSNEREYKKLLDEDYQAAIADGIADAVSQYFRYVGATGHNKTGTQSSGEAVKEISVKGVALPETLKLEAGATGQLNAAISPSDASDQSVTFESDDESVASVTDDGEVTAEGEGTALITVTTNDGGYTASCKVTVTAGSGGSQKPRPPASDGEVTVSLSTHELTLKAGEEAKLKYTVKPSGADPAVEWETDDDAVAEVTQSGKVTAVGSGKAIVSVITEDGEYDECVVTVTDGEASAIQDLRLDLHEVYLEVKDSCKLAYTIEPSKMHPEVLWETDDKGIVKVTPTGTITAVAEGEAVITLSTKDGEWYDDCVVTVLADGAGGMVTSVSLDEESLTLKAGQAQPLTASVRPADADDAMVWTSSDESVVTVSEDGVAEAVGKGSATITATAVSGGKSASCTVKVQ